MILYSSGYSSDGLDLNPVLSNQSRFGSNNLRLDPVRSNGTDISMVSPSIKTPSILSPSSQSYMSTPGINSAANSNRPGWSNAANSNSVDNKKKDVITYDVYPEDVQDLASEYIQLRLIRLYLYSSSAQQIVNFIDLNLSMTTFNRLCKNLHRLGLLLSDYMRYGDAKREYSKALQIFRKLKIKPQLYEDILTEIRITQRNSANSNSSSRNRAQHLAKRTPTTGSRSRAPQSPSFSFSFSQPTIHNSDVSPFMVATAK